MTLVHDQAAILDAVLREYALPPDGAHGVVHWARVLENGQRVADANGADHEVVMLFALFHDARRVNEHIDHGHGTRGGDFAYALRGTLVHEILDLWHKARRADPGLALAPFAAQHFADQRVHPLFRVLWQPRLIAALTRFEDWVRGDEAEGRVVLASEISGTMEVDGVKVLGRADRIDRQADGSLVIVDYKTGAPPSKAQVTAGYALQLGLLGLIARDGRFENIKTGEVVTGTATRFEYWSLGKSRKEDGFGYRETPMKEGSARTGLPPEDYLPFHADKLDEAIRLFIKGRKPFIARENPDYKGYNEYDQMMRLEEWLVRLTGQEEGA